MKERVVPIPMATQNLLAIRSANQSDKDWVNAALASEQHLYSEDSATTTTEEIFSSHVHGGSKFDYVLPSGNYLLVAEADQKPNGLIHLVAKDSMTVEIRHLIIEPRLLTNASTKRTISGYVALIASQLRALQLYSWTSRLNEAMQSLLVGDGYRTHYPNPGKESPDYILYKRVIDTGGFNPPKNL